MTLINIMEICTLEYIHMDLTDTAKLMYVPDAIIRQIDRQLDFQVNPEIQFGDKYQLVVL